MPKHYWIKFKPLSPDSEWRIGTRYDNVEVPWAVAGSDETYRDDELVIGPEIGKEPEYAHSLLDALWYGRYPHLTPKENDVTDQRMEEVDQLAAGPGEPSQQPLGVLEPTEPATFPTLPG
jgi:hypothetical protein